MSVRPRRCLPAAATLSPARPPVVVSSLSSDAHTWNLVFLQLLIEEAGLDVVNLGPCVPTEMLVSECRERRPGLIVLSSVNGHGYLDGRRAIAGLRACPALARTPVVIGGKIGTSGAGRAEHARELVNAGYDAVYDDATDDGPAAFLGLVARVAAVRA
jgi:methylaspartate mutase sigma subunit